MPGAKFYIPPQEPRLCKCGALLYYGEGPLGERIDVARVTNCTIASAWMTREYRGTVYLLSCDEHIAVAPAYTAYKGRYVGGTLLIRTREDAYGKEYTVLTFEPSAKHLDRFEEPKYFE